MAAHRQRTEHSAEHAMWMTSSAVGDAFPPALAPLEALASAHGTPYYLLHEVGIRAAVRGLLAPFRAQFGPAAFNFYAVKALPNPAVLRIVTQEGCGLDCSSLSELWIAKVRWGEGAPPGEGSVIVLVCALPAPGHSRLLHYVYFKLHLRP